MEEVLLVLFFQDFLILKIHPTQIRLDQILVADETKRSDHQFQKDHVKVNLHILIQFELKNQGSQE